MLKKHLLLSVMFILFFLSSGLWSQELWKDLKKTNRAVHDFAGIVDSGTERKLESLLTELYNKTRSSQVVVTVPDLGGLTVEDFANRLFEKWGIGDAKTDKGVLLLIAPKERKLRIEVGYGLEPVITDLQAKTIIDQHIVPLFKKGNMSAGVYQGSLELMHLIASDSNVTLSEARPAAPMARADKDSISLGDVLFYLLFAAIIGFQLFGPRTHRRRGTTYWTGGSGGWGGGGFGGGSSGGFGGFGGGMSGGGGASGGW